MADTEFQRHIPNVSVMHEHSFYIPGVNAELVVVTCFTHICSGTVCGYRRQQGLIDF